MDRVLNAGEFKSDCLKLTDEVAIKQETIVITKRGKPVAQFIPISKSKPKSLLGFMKGQVRSIGDIISPIDVEWDVLKE